MKVTWAVQPDCFGEDCIPLLDEIRAQGHQLHIVEYSPLNTKSYDALGLDNTCVVFYGSISLALSVRRKYSLWLPGILSEELKNYDCTTYYSQYGKHLLNDDYCMLPYREVRRRFPQLCASNKYKNDLFIRPNSGLKPFTGQLTSNGSVPVVFADIPDDTLVVVSSPKNIFREWRFVICDNKVLCGCQYMENGEVSLSPEVSTPARDKAEEIASESWQPDRMYTVDICSTDHGGGGVRLLEINSLSCSGLYLCDPKPIVEHASRVAMEFYNDYMG